jgi:hypothetical protein
MKARVVFPIHGSRIIAVRITTDEELVEQNFIVPIEVPPNHCFVVTIKRNYKRKAKAKK